MEAKNLAVTKVSEEQINTFLESLNGKCGYFDMYHFWGPTNCFCVPEAIAVVMDEHNWSDCGGGIERNNSIKIFNEKLEIIAESAGVNYRHRSDGRYDNYFNEYREILDVKKTSGGFDIKVMTGVGRERTVHVPRKSPNKAE